MVVVTNEKHLSLVTLSLPIYISLLKYICISNVKLIVSFCIAFISLYNPKKKINYINFCKNSRYSDISMYKYSKTHKIT